MDAYCRRLESLVLKHYNNTGTITPVFYADLFDIISSYESLGDRLKNVELRSFNLENPSIMASYRFEDKKMIIYMSNINNDAIAFDSNVYSDGNMLHRYLFPIQSVLHEVEHVKQSKSISEGKNDFETKLFSISDPIMAKKINPDIDIPMSSFSKEQNESYYFFNPLERLAEIRSIEKTLKVTSTFGYYSIRLTDFFTRCLIGGKLMGYNVCKSPTKAFLIDSGMYDNFKKIEYLTRGFDDDTKCIYGLETSDSLISDLKRKDNKILLKYTR